jgi:polysaccharide export outer membrane protein
MKKALLAGILSLLALAPFHCALAQAGINNTPAVRAVEKSSAAVGSTDERKSQDPTSKAAGRKITVRRQSDAATASATAPITRTANGDPGSTNKAIATDESALTAIYKVGVGDVLDIHLLNSDANRSTLYIVIEGGLIDFPIAGRPILVEGLTTKEIQARITAELKRLAMEDRAQVTVGVRQYASHSVIISGLLVSPGTKILRREAVPLYVLLAEVQPSPDAARAAIMRAGAPTRVVDLSDAAGLNSIVRPGDVINLTSRPEEFYYIAGRIRYPGQKAFLPGITLVQAILAAGSLARDNVVELSREGSDGRLAATKFNLKAIKSGKLEDPKLQPGDRIEILD